MARPENDEPLISVIAGPMGCGKSEELLRRIHIEEYLGSHIVVFKPKADTRTEYEIFSRSSGHYPAINVSTAQELYDDVLQIIEHYPQDDFFIAIDEAQLFDQEIAGVIKSLAHDHGIQITASELVRDSRSAFFGRSTDILGIAEDIMLLHARCGYIIDQNTEEKCGRRAYETGRTINGQDANWNEPQVIIDDQNAKEGKKKVEYGARCRLHHRVPAAPPTREIPYSK